MSYGSQMWPKISEHKSAASNYTLISILDYFSGCSHLSLVLSGFDFLCVRRGLSTKILNE